MNREVSRNLLQQTTTGRSSPLGATVSREGANFSVYSKHTTGIELLFFDRADDARPSNVIRIDPATNHAGCYVITDDAEGWHARFVAAGLQVTPVEDMPWGMHEFTLTDPSGNNIRVGRSVADAA